MNNQIQKYNIQSLALKNERLNKGVAQATFDLINALSTDSQKEEFLELAIQGKFDAKVALACITQTPTKYYEGCTSVTTVKKAFEEKTPTLAQLKKYLGEPVQRAFVEMVINQFIEMYGLKKAYSMPIVRVFLRNYYNYSVAELHYIFNDYIPSRVDEMYGTDALQIIKVINMYDTQERDENYLTAVNTSNPTPVLDDSRFVECNVDFDATIKRIESASVSDVQKEKDLQRRVQSKREMFESKITKGQQRYADAKKSHKPEPEMTERNKQFIEKYTP